MHLSLLNINGLAMMVHRDGLSDPGSKRFYVGLQQDLSEGDDHAEYEPDVDHLDVGRLGEVVEDSNIHRHEDQHDGQVDWNEKNNLRHVNLNRRTIEKYLHSHP